MTYLLESICTKRTYRTLCTSKSTTEHTNRLEVLFITLIARRVAYDNKFGLAHEELVAHSSGEKIPGEIFHWSLTKLRIVEAPEVTITRAKLFRADVRISECKRGRTEEDRDRRRVEERKSQMRVPCSSTCLFYIWDVTVMSIK